MEIPTVLSTLFVTILIVLAVGLVIGAVYWLFRYCTKSSSSCFVLQLLSLTFDLIISPP